MRSGKMSSAGESARTPASVRKVKISHKAVVRAQRRLRPGVPVTRAHSSTASKVRRQSPPTTSETKTRPSTKVESRRKESTLDNSKYQDLRQKLFDNPNLTKVRTRDLNGMSSHLREYSAWSALRRDYDEAKRSNTLLDDVRTEIARRTISHPEADDDDDAFQSRLDRQMCKLEKQVVEFNDNTSHRREQMLARHQDELDKFETIWREEMPRKYRKLSPRLLTLLSSEKMCVRTGDYDKAKSYKIEADRLMKIEMAQAQAQLNSDYKKAKEKLLAKHQEEIDRMEQIRSDQKVLLVSKHRQELKNIANRHNVLNIKGSARGREDAPKPVGGLTRLMQSGGLDYETLLPPLIPPNDERMIEQEQKTQKNKREKRKRIRARLERRREEKERKFKELQEQYEESLREESRKWRHPKQVVFQTQPDVVAPEPPATEYSYEEERLDPASTRDFAEYSESYSSEEEESESSSKESQDEYDYSSEYDDYYYSDSK